MIKCENCGKELRDNAKFCGGCGTAYTEPEPVKITECPKCGTELRENAKFCGKCGNVIGAVGTKTPQSALTAKTSTLKKPIILKIFFALSSFAILLGIILALCGIYEDEDLVYRGLETVIVGIAGIIVLLNIINDKKIVLKTFFMFSCLIILLGLLRIGFGFSSDFRYEAFDIIENILDNIYDGLFFLPGLGILIAGSAAALIIYKIIRGEKWTKMFNIILSGALGALLIISVICIEYSLYWG